MWSKIQIYNTKIILKDIKNKINKNESFSLIRFGDGGLKFMSAYLSNNLKQLKEICVHEGIPGDKIKDVIESWTFFANKSDYIDTPKVYFEGKFWSRVKKNNKPMSSHTNRLLMNWYSVYNKIGISHTNKYCNPEINFLMLIKTYRRENILDILKNKNVCFITACDFKNEELQFFTTWFKKLDIIKIVGWNQNHYENSFIDTVNFIKKRSNDYDIYLVSGGELGRIYTGMIKYYGGRALDMGTVLDYWQTRNIPDRLQLFLRQDKNNKYLLNLTNMGRKYKDI